MVSKLKLKKYKIHYLKHKILIWKINKFIFLKNKKNVKCKMTKKVNITKLPIKFNIESNFFKLLINLKITHFSVNNFVSNYFLKKLILRVFRGGNNIFLYNSFFYSFYYISKKFKIPIRSILIFLFSKIENALVLKIFFLRKSKILMPVPNLDLQKSLREGISWFKRCLNKRVERTLTLRLIGELEDLSKNKGFMLQEKKTYISTMLLSAAQNRRYQKFLLKNAI